MDAGTTQTICSTGAKRDKLQSTAVKAWEVCQEKMLQLEEEDRV